MKRKDLDFDAEVDTVLELARLTPIHAAYMVLSRDTFHLRCTLNEALQMMQDGDAVFRITAVHPALLTRPHEPNSQESAECSLT